MAIQPAVCTNCGGILKVDDTDLNGFCECQYCHTPHKVIDVITIDGLPTVKSLLSSADFALEDRNFEKAVSLYNDILNIKPNCHEAWWGLYICNAFFDQYYGYQDKYGNSGPWVKAGMLSETISKYADRAIKYAPPAQADTYKREIQGSLEYIEMVHNGQVKEKKPKNGCYIATAVYGDYNCAEVLTLRRYRDLCLAKHFLGRLFIKFYYLISPILARHIGKNSCMGKLIRRYLDKKVKYLSASRSYR